MHAVRGFDAIWFRNGRLDIRSPGQKLPIAYRLSKALPSHREWGGVPRIPLPYEMAIHGTRLRQKNAVNGNFLEDWGRHDKPATGSRRGKAPGVMNRMHLANISSKAKATRVEFGLGSRKPRG
jgi:hypothetical protein